MLEGKEIPLVDDREEHFVEVRAASMNLSDMRFPRQLEADYGPDVIRHALTDRTLKLWSGGDLDVPLIAMKDPLKKALQAAALKGRLRCGFEGVSHKLNNEKAGIELVRERSDVSRGERISRLILLSNDGAERFYRHVEQLLRSHAPRLLVCLLDADAGVLGKLVTAKDRPIKLVMAEHKDAVSEILRAILGGAGGPGAEGLQTTVAPADGFRARHEPTTVTREKEQNG